MYGLLINQEDEPLDNAGRVNDNGDESSKLDGKDSEFADGGMENVMQIESDVSDSFIVFFFFVFQPTVLVPLSQVLFPSLKFCYRSNG